MRIGRDEIGVIVIDELETRHGAKTASVTSASAMAIQSEAGLAGGGGVLRALISGRKRRKKLASTWAASFSNGRPSSSAANS
jgi:hypothetical protein